MNHEFIMRFSKVLKKIVLITGCSSGIGAASALLLRKAGWHVIPTARRKKHLDVLTKNGFKPLNLDLADSSSIQAAFHNAMEQSSGGLAAVVNNGGFGQPGAVEDLSREVMRQQFEVNFFGMQELTNLCIPVFRKQGYGRIINVSSSVGRIALPFAGIYSASKFAMEGITDALRMELYGSGIAVSLIEPGPIDTSFFEKVIQKTNSLDIDRSFFRDTYTGQLQISPRDVKKTSRFLGSAKDVAMKIQHALESDRPARRYKVTASAYITSFLRRVSPDACIDFLLVRSWKKRSAGK